MWRNVEKLPEKLQKLYKRVLVIMILLFTLVAVISDFSWAILYVLYVLMLAVIDAFFIPKALYGKVWWLFGDLLFFLWFLLLAYWNYNT